MTGRKAIAVIGEGITEKYYIESLKGLSPFTVLPRSLGTNASNLPKLADAIEASIRDGYDEVFCLIDMDGKRDGENRAAYLRLKAKYHDRVHGNKRKGVQCRVMFVETERCTELWFLYHFTRSAVTREFTSYREVEHELHKYRPQYEKTERYFRSVGSLHRELTADKGGAGSLQQAIRNAESSLASRLHDGRKYTYSEMHWLIEALGILK